MKLRDQLPYFGTEQEDGSLKTVFGLILKSGTWERPNYEEFMEDKYQNENFCAEVLIGLKNFSIIYGFAESTIFKTDHSDQNLRTVSEPGSTTISFMEHKEVLKIVMDIKKMIDNGIKSGNLDFIDHSEPDETDHKDYIALANQVSPFRIYYSYNTSDFLNWAEYYGYRIPSEVTSLLKNSSETISETKEFENKEAEFDKFIRSMRISYENNSEINIHLPRKPKESVTAQSLGFKNEIGMTWKDFLTVLQDFPNYLFRLGSSPKEKDASRQRLKEINKKLLIYFSNKYDFTPPYKFKLFEQAKEKVSGSYRFKFQIGDAGSSFKSARELKEKIEKEIARSENDINTTEIIDLIREGLETKFLNHSEAEKYFHQISIPSDNIF